MDFLKYKWKAEAQELQRLKPHLQFGDMFSIPEAIRAIGWNRLAAAEQGSRKHSNKQIINLKYKMRVDFDLEVEMFCGPCVILAKKTVSSRIKANPKHQF
ncbi:hypothetical protein [Leptospira brenneri]|uniref:hypothetical protein n=1 Tax=Leptospira brenneri TaxID=2023182 RepID=UPI001FCABFD3|nr:hypothetical protein [Leptospira brenneri]